MLPAMVREAARSDPAQRAQLEASFTKRLDELNELLDPHERLGFIVLVADAWTQESGHVTGTLKVKRDRIDDSYSRHFDDWAGQAKPVVWHGF